MSRQKSNDSDFLLTLTLLADIIVAQANLLTFHHSTRQRISGVVGHFSGLDHTA